MLTRSMAGLLLAFYSVVACSNGDGMKLSDAAGYDLEADSVFRYIADLEKTPQGAEKLHKTLTAVLAQPALKGIMSFRNNSPVGKAVFTNQFISKYQKSLRSMSFASLYNLKPGSIHFSDGARSELASAATRLSERAPSQRPENLQLLDNPADAKCENIKSDYEDKSGITAQRQILDPSCNWLCKMAVGATMPSFMSVQNGGPTSGGALKAAGTHLKFVAESAINHCSDGRSQAGPTAAKPSDSGGDQKDTSVPLCVNDAPPPGFDSCWGGDMPKQDQ
ncbi:MAG: hypothetical protein NTY08_04725 [Proteobacteria bacterium]|nr:hypothetical protein [Pseudomonadota bacterium]